MSNTPHELADDFPDQIDLIHRLKTENTHFAKLCDEYHEINRAVHRAETLVEPTDALHETEMRQKRARLKDQINAMLSAA